MPQSIQKSIADIMEGAYGGGFSSAKRYAQVAEELVEYTVLPSVQLNQKIKKLEQQMYQHAKDLEFEEAARLRDQIHHIRQVNLGLSE